MYKFEFGIEEEKDYDIRKIPCGRWPAARITTRSSGKWCQFIDIDSNKTINQAMPIDYKKKYKPPKRPKTAQYPRKTQTLNLYKEAVLTLAPQVVQEIADSTYSQTMYNSPPFEPPVSSLISSKSRSQQITTRSKSRSRSPSPNSMDKNPEEQDLALTARSTLPNTREPLFSTRSSKMAQTARLPKPEEKETAELHHHDFSSIQMPDTPRIIAKRHGDDPEKFPFRVSTIYLAELGEEQERKEREKEKSRSSRPKSVTKKRDNRPSTSAQPTRRKGFMPNDQNRRIKQVPKKTGQKGSMAIVGRSMTSFQ